MPISKSVEVSVFGAPAQFHKIVNYSVDVPSGNSTATVLQYFSQDAAALGRQPMASEHIQIVGLPPADQPTLAWLEQKLIEAEPEQGGEYQPPNRYVLAGGTIIA